MKKSELIFSSLLVPIDYIMLILAGMTAYTIRFSRIYQEQIREVVFNLEFAAYMGLVWKIALVWIVLFAIAGLYIIRPRGRAEEVSKVFLACSSGVMAVVVYIFLQRELFASRFIVLAAWLLAIIYVSFARIIVRGIQIRLLKKGIGKHRVLIVGDDDTTNRLIDIFQKRPELGIKITHNLTNLDNGNMEKVKKWAKDDELDEIIQGDAGLPKEQSMALIDISRDWHINFRYAADLFAAQSTNISVNTLSGIPLVEVKRTKLEGWGRIGKRIFDFVIAISGLIILAPFFAIIGVMIKADSRGPVIVKLKRVGSRGREFYLYKFRSMVVGADRMKQTLERYNERKDGPLFKMTKDPRITRFGRFLRRMSIDELPQLWNIVIGDMSLVGPRPHEPQEVAQYKKHHKHLLDIKPGITGMAQVSGRSDLPFEDEVKLDVFYIENWSLRLDIVILLRTPIAILSKKAAV